MSLKEITQDLHEAAEHTQFAQVLLSGNITKEEYLNYLYNMLAIYDPIEWYCNRLGFFDNMPTLPRLQAIYEDFREIDDGSTLFLVPSTIKYINYLHTISNDPERMNDIKAHLYCRHMGDLHGGQIIKKKVPFSSGKFYEFENASDLRTNIRAALDDSLGNEARVAFQYAIDIMKDLYNE